MSGERVNAALEPLVVSIDELQADPDNARRHSERNITAVAESLIRFGQQKPLIAVRGSGLVVAGNARLEAARRLGWERVAVAWYDSEQEARAFAVADNRSAELATWDGIALLEAVAELERADFEPAALGFSAEELDLIRRKSVTDVEVAGVEIVEGAAEYRCPRCGHEWDDPGEEESA